MPEHTYALKRAAVEALLVLEDAEIKRVLLALELLVEQPDKPPDSATRDDQGRQLLFRYVGELIIVYYRSYHRNAVTVIDITQSRH
jgi:hypothetical protein